ncbi:MAG: DUF3035 domain-containing protein [Rhizomicrobium sp.]|jgi:hypothetical protein
MWNDKRVHGKLLLVATMAAAVSLTACESIRSAAGIGKEPPDEFAVVTKAPLIMPPDYNLKPPKPGAPPLNQVSPTESAQAALYNDDPRAVASAINGNYSQGEKLLLAQTGAATASDTIRQQVAADNRGLDSADESFTDQLLFSSSGTDAPVNADAEKARLGAGKTSPQAQQPQQAQPPQDQKKDSGWLDGIF